MRKSNAENQAAFRKRGRAEYLEGRLASKVKQAHVVAAELGDIRGTQYIVAVIPTPKLLAESIIAREREQGISAGEQVKTFFLAGAEVIHRAIDVALARGIVTPDDQAKLVDRLAAEVAKFSGEVELERVEGAPK